MKVSTFLTVKAVISLLFGIAFALLPAAVMSLYGVTLDLNGAFMARYLGAGLIGIGLVCWFGKNVANDGRRGITLALFIGDTIGFVVALMMQLSGTVNALGWVNVLIWLLLALGNGYCRFMRLGAS